MTTACMNCPHRTPGCHARCETYAVESLAAMLIRAKENTARKHLSDVESVGINRTARMEKSHMKKRQPKKFRMR